MMYHCTVALSLLILYSGLSFANDPCDGGCAEGTFCSKPHNYCKCQLGLINRVEHNRTFTCDTDIDECAITATKMYDCPANSSCVNTHGAYTCQCDGGLYLTKSGYCQPDVDECFLGVYSCPENTDCQNTLGSYTCRCAHGFSPAPNGTCFLVIEKSSYWWVGLSVFGGAFVLIATCTCVYAYSRNRDSSDMDDSSDEKLTEIVLEERSFTNNSSSALFHPVMVVSQESIQDGKVLSAASTEEQTVQENSKLDKDVRETKTSDLSIDEVQPESITKENNVLSATIPEGSDVSVQGNGIATKGLSSADLTLDHDTTTTPSRVSGVQPCLDRTMDGGADSQGKCMNNAIKHNEFTTDLVTIEIEPGTDENWNKV